VNFYDAHNHLQDARLTPFREPVVMDAQRIGVRRMVVNGTGEHDWPQVAELAERYPDLVIPAFGLHPWQVGQQSTRWQEALRKYLECFPAAPVGEVGLDRWVEGHDVVAQAQALQAQLVLARELNRPVVIHCLKAFGVLENLLRESKPLPRGFLLHSYGGSLEQMRSFAALGGWFSCSGYFFHDRKAAQRKVFAEVPLDRLLVETDAPDMLGPEACITNVLPGGAASVALNHPANLSAIYAAVAQLREIPLTEFVEGMEKNFKCFFEKPYTNIEEYQAGSF
jgi:TatD DNase family protein